MYILYRDRALLGAVWIAETAIRFQDIRPSLFWHVTRRSLYNCFPTSRESHFLGLVRTKTYT
jgi:hypothetical protein